MACENCNPQIQLVKGVAYKIVNGKKIDVTHIDAPACDCGINTCDCSINMIDLVTGTKYVVYVAEGVLTVVTETVFEALKEAGDFTAPI